MKLSKDELKEKINTYEDMTEETKISLLEDIEDSVDVVEEPQVNEFEEKFNELSEKYNVLQEKYKSRFFEKVDEKIEPIKEEPIEEKPQYVDVKFI